MALTLILRKFAVYVDGVGKLGQGENAKLPTMETLTEDYRPGGMDIPIKVDIGMQPLAFSFKLSAMDPKTYGMFGLAPVNVSKVGYTVTGALVDFAGAPHRAMAQMQGYMGKVDVDDFVPGKKILHAFCIALTYYKLTVDEAAIYEIDPMNGKRIIGGVDQIIRMEA